MGIDNRTDLCPGYLSNGTTVQPPEWNPVAVAPGRPDKDSLELGVTLHRPKVLLDLRLNTPPGSLPSVLLRHSASESMQRDRTVIFRHARGVDMALPTFLREYEKVAQQCAAEGLDHVQFLARLVELELIDRERRLVERRIRQAGFPVVKQLESFDFKAIPSLNKMLVLDLACGDYIDRRENVILLGVPSIYSIVPPNDGSALRHGHHFEPVDFVIDHGRGHHDAYSAGSCQRTYARACGCRQRPRCHREELIESERGWSGREAFVTMMQTADLGQGNDRSGPGRLNGSSIRGVLAERQVGP